MRDILDKLQLLVESTGLAGRKPGDIFRNPAGDEVTFQSLQLFPDGGGKYTPEELDAELANWENRGVEWTNSRSGRTGGFAIATFQDSNENQLLQGTYLEKIKANVTDNYVANQYRDYRFGGRAAEKSQAGLSPQDLLTDKIDLDISGIMNQLAKKLGTDHPLYEVAHRVAMGEGPRDGDPVEFAAPDDISFSAFRDYFCEILQPIALQRGCFTGNAGEAADKFLDGGFAGTLISFDDSKTAGLSDSIMTSGDKFIKISSKGGKGATATVRNLFDSIEELQQTAAGRKMLKKYAAEVDLIRNIVEKGQNGAPLYLGVKYDLISESDADDIRMLRGRPPMDLERIGNTNLSAKVKELARGRNTDNPKSVNLYYHLIAAVAHKAAEIVNERTDFSSAAADILNNGALVQVYTVASQGKKTWTLREFNTVYPGKSIRGVFMSATKTYYSTGIKGNFTFKIDKGDKKDAAETKETERRSAKSDIENRDLAQSAEKITRGGQEPAISKRKVGDVGRKLR